MFLWSLGFKMCIRSNGYVYKTSQIKGNKSYTDLFYIKNSGN